MNILITNFGPLDSPEISLAESLLELGHSLMIASYELDTLPPELQNSPSVECVNLGSWVNNPSKSARYIKNPAIVRSLLHRRSSEIDLVWTIGDITVRDIGKPLFELPHVMQLYELCEYTPALFRHPMPIHSSLVIEAARRAKCVVVPEYNRACIQRAWWGLSQTPAVLPNKPHHRSSPSDAAKMRARETFDGENRKVLLYQGIFTPERNLKPFASAMALLGGDYVLCLMGDCGTNQAKAYVSHLVESNENVRYIGYERTPDHLPYTSYGHIGLMVYVPQNVGYISPLNGLFCAPNKIWEYSMAGLPMLSNDLPGLRSSFQANGCGLVSPLEPYAIAEAIRKIDGSYDSMSADSLKFYESVNVLDIIRQILAESR